MAKQSAVLRPNATSGHLDYQTWILKVYIHCEGCKKKVFKVLQSIDGVYKTVIDSKQHKAIVSGSVDGNTLVQKLLKSGKHAEILPESFEASPAADTGSEKSNQKKEKNKQKNGVTTTGDDDDETVENEEKKEESEEEDEEAAATADGSDAGNNPDVAPPPPAAAAAGDGNVNGNGNGNGNGGGKKKKNKKKKKKKGDKTDGETDGAPAGNAPAVTGAKAENLEASSMEQLNLNRPVNQMVYAAPYDLPPYPAPPASYGMSYNTSYPSTESSYYTPPVYGYAHSHPSVYYYYPPQPPPWYYPRSAFDEDNNNNNQDASPCTIM